MEEWRDVKGYEGMYQISNYGRVKSLGRIDRLGQKVDEKMRNQQIDKNGYKSVMLSKDGNRKRYLVHRLVAEAFIPNPNNYPQINHKDENKINNKVNNLEWCDRKYNMNYGTRSKRQSENLKGKYVGGNHPKSKKIKCITTGETFGGIREACRKYNIHSSDVSKCCRGKLNYVGKHPITGEKLVWQYVEEVMLNG